MSNSNELAKQGIEAFRGGDVARAASLFKQAVQQDQSNQVAWLWLAECVDNEQDKRQCLEQVVSINPGNEAGQRAQTRLDQMAPAGGGESSAGAATIPIPSPQGVTEGSPEPTVVSSSPASSEPVWSPPAGGSSAAGSVGGSSQSTFGQRLLGIITFKTEVYREVVHDDNATMQAMMIQVGLLVLVFIPLFILMMTGAIGSMGAGDMMQGTGVVMSFLIFIILLVVVILFTLLFSWIGGAIYALVANALKGSTTTARVYRIIGYSYIFLPVALVPCIGGIATTILQAIAVIIGIREGSGLTTGKAVLTYFIPGIVVMLLACGAGLVLGMLGVGVESMSQPSF